MKDCTLTFPTQLLYRDKLNLHCTDRPRPQQIACVWRSNSLLHGTLLLETFGQSGSAMICNDTAHPM